MQIDKERIVGFLRERGDTDKASAADEELPEKVDTDKPEHASLLERLGIDPMDLARKFMDGKGIPGF